MDNLDSVIQAANAGNVNAMLTLSQHYNEQKDISRATEWADKAAEAGSVAGYMISMSCHRFSITVAKELGFWQLLEEEAHTTMNRADTLLRAHSEGSIALSNDQICQCEDCRNEALYALGLRIYAEDENNQRWREIIDLISTVHSTKAFALHGCCSVHLDNYDKAFQMMQRVVKDRDYAAQQKEVTEEAIYCDLLRYMAAFYRIGVPGVVNQDLDTAVSILTFGLSSMYTKDFKKYFEEELRHYQKKLFGGYKYV